MFWPFVWVVKKGKTKQIPSVAALYDVNILPSTLMLKPTKSNWNFWVKTVCNTNRTSILVSMVK